MIKIFSKAHASPNTTGLVLLGKGGEQDDCVFPLLERALGIGTDPNNCSIIYSKKPNGIAAFHCQLVPQGGIWYLTDFSDTGTWLNGQKMIKFQAYPLKVGDVFYLARLENSFCLRNNDTDMTFPPSSTSPSKTLPPQPPHTNIASPFQEGVGPSSILEGPSTQPPQLSKAGLKEKFLTFKGRLNRKAYFIRMFYLNVVNFILYFLTTFICTLADVSEEVTLIVPALIIIVVMLIPGSSLVIRRLHDLDKSGWFYLIMCVPIVNFYVLYLLFIEDGTHGENRFGAEYHYQAPSQAKLRDFEEKYLTFEGRLNRKAYIFRQLFLLGLSIGIGFIAALILALCDAYESVITAVAQTALFTFLYPIAFLSIRRLHDLDNTGWLYLIMFVPFVNIIFWIYISFKKGTHGSNRFGVAPLS